MQNELFRGFTQNTWYASGALIESNEWKLPKFDCSVYAHRTTSRFYLVKIRANFIRTHDEHSPTDIAVH